MTVEVAYQQELEFVHRLRRHVTFLLPLQDGYRRPEQVTIPLGVWREMGEPRTVRVTVEAL